MAETIGFALTTAWTEVASGSANVLVQSRMSGVVRVHVGASAPAADAAHITLAGDDDSIALGSLEATDKVYARTSTGTGNITVIRS